MTALPGLDPPQRDRLAQWFGDVELLADMSWGLVDTVVLYLRTNEGDVVVKAAGTGDVHLDREITAHEQWLVPWVSQGRAPELLRANREISLLVTRYLPGHLVQGDSAEDDPDTYHQAGHLLAQLHRQAARTDPEYETAGDLGVLRNLEKPHRIAPETLQRIHTALEDHPGGGARVVPTHGDYQPRNWLVHEGAVAVIDFGRAQWRPAYTDFARLAAQQFRGRPDLEHAFKAGYGSDPREAGPWQRYRLREAVGTAVWAYQVGDEGFEAQGHRMIADALATADART